MSLPVTPKKSLGQNFLNSERVITRIVDAANPGNQDVVLEIGPGLGMLTKKLITVAQKTIAVEKDDTLYSILKETFAEALKSETLELIHQDITEFDPEQLRTYGSAYMVVANIPYNLTGFIIRKFLTTSYQPTKMVLLIQKEVATRILAKNNKESLLSLSVKAFGTPRLVTHVARGNFNPVPNVDSSVISIESITRDHFIHQDHEHCFFTLIHAGFAHKRKQLLGNFLDANLGTAGFWEPLLQQKNIPLTVRAEDLTLSDWIFLSQMMYTMH